MLLGAFIAVALCEVEGWIILQLCEGDAGQVMEDASRSFLKISCVLVVICQMGPNCGVVSEFHCKGIVHECSYQCTLTFFSSLCDKIKVNTHELDYLLVLTSPLCDREILISCFLPGCTS